MKLAYRTIFVLTFSLLTAIFIGISILMFSHTEDITLSLKEIPMEKPYSSDVINNNIRVVIPKEKD